MNISLFVQAILKYFIGLITVSLLLFIPGTIEYWNGWLFICLLFIPMFIAGIILMIKDPSLLKERLDINEKEEEQKQVIIYSGIMFILGFVIAGLNYRYSWLILSKQIVITSSVVFIFTYILYGEVLRENRYLSRTIKVSENQKLIDKGMYKIVRHPMYLVTVILFLTIPLILGSLISFIIFLAYPIVIIKRIKNEEQVLEKQLKGYKEYEKKVKYRLIPYIW
ncbi:MAG: isoprenylcysteine carboxylmethyltransferase family protein [Bacilli bacterium]|nr:isoprenylcysteine carboxylmethyltransferase family protein [Bacilli bacterium]MBR3209468.1 isoprenylcysteine carboxylmethyltransferase family protein [Bacilli bacterium]